MKRLASQVDTIILVNNSPIVSLNFIQDIYGNLTSIEVVNLEKNYGLAFAHNTGLEIATNRGCEYALLFDQDSLPERGMVKKCCRY